MKGYALLMVWGLLMLCALGYLAKRQIIDFDPQGSLLNASMSSEFEREIESHFAKHYPTLANLAVHIQSEQCQCNFANNIHRSTLEKTLDSNHFHSRMMLAKESKLPSSILPSTPAIAIFDPVGKLAYYGPYSSGFLCGSSSGYVEKFLPTISNGKYIGPLIISDSQGCYCNT